ncbi:GNAT family N-acetyltransferase [Homoserinibacter sp. GY 40078]|uniref:GNAT family N-acetyltransferase n=1 Tax=Homoserinibacter sp. GY 40078 TaxID=2603275 RepID=UPI0011CA52EB|nr:GNAT family N-acetyltransferase [Homoserinibacter sp. GY 40078]TXK17747.1 N-acetyltransferase [Homoserinibacter sp. GY 40078]
MPIEISHEPDAHRYTLRRGGAIVSVLEYLDHGPSVVFHHTITVPNQRGHGYAAQLVEFAVNDVEHSGRSITPSCWYVADWFDAHPERSGVLAR